jgi:predicted membrane-bound spermidine synthase
VAAWCAVAFASGVAALAFETLWFRVAGLSLGNGVWASSVVLAAFMAGLALGNGLAARRADRVARPERVFAGLELTIGVAGVVLVAGLPAATPGLARALEALRDSPWLLNPARLLVAFAAMMVPATAMGATLPVLVRTLSRHDPRFGTVLGRLYGWNTIGAVAGALLGESLLLGALGMRGSAFAAAGANLLAAAGALSLSGPRGAPSLAAPAPAAPAATGRAPRLLAAAFLSGAVFLALEVVWFRFLALFVYGTSLVFAVLLAVVLAGIALGGLSAARWLRRGGRAAAQLPALALLAACATLLGYLGFERVLAAFLPPGLAAAELWHVALLAMPLMLPVAWLSGILFTALGEAARTRLGGDARTAGLLALSNTVGAACGSLAGGFVLLPRLGMEASFLLLAGLYALVAALTLPERAGGALPLRAGGVRAWPVPGALAAALVALLATFPGGLLRSTYLLHPTRAFEEPGTRVIAVREGLLQTVVLTRTERFGRPLHHRMFTDGFSMSATTAHSRRYMKAYVYLPVAIHPRLRDALLISYGVGSTAKALTDTTELERIDVVDISPEILATSRLLFAAAEDPLADPRVRVHVEDGRFFLETTPHRYDLITSEPPPPKYAGVVNLYSREYFALIREHLAEGGITTYWLPVHNLSEGDALAIVRAFCDVFADCTLWSGAGLDWMLVGTRGFPGAEGPVEAHHFRRQWEDPRVAPELRATGFETPGQLGATFLAGAATLGRLTREVAPVLDDFPLRISHEPVLPGHAARSPLFAELMGAGAAAREFDESEFVRRTFPPELRAETHGAFAWQRILNARLVQDGAEAAGQEDLHELLARSPLRTLPLWLLGSGQEEVRIVSGMAPGAAPQPDVDRVRALGAMAERDFAGAVRWLERARAARPDDVRLASLEIYALCMAERGDEALALARRLVRSDPQAAASDAHWRWLGETFGLPDPRLPASEAASGPGVLP